MKTSYIRSEFSAIIVFGNRKQKMYTFSRSFSLLFCLTHTHSRENPVLFTTSAFHHHHPSILISDKKLLPSKASTTSISYYYNLAMYTRFVSFSLLHIMLKYHVVHTSYLEKCAKQDKREKEV